MLRVRRDEVWRDKGLVHFDEQVKRYNGPAYDPGIVSGSQHDPYNAAFGYISNVLPKLAFANPKVRVGTSRQGPYELVAKAQHHYLNRWIRDTNFHRHLEVVGTDYLMNWAMTGIMMEPRPGFRHEGEPNWWPQVFRIPQRQCGFDHTATSWDTKKHSWHMTIEELEVMRDLAKEDAELPEDEREGWDLDAIERLSVGEGVSKARPELDGSAGNDIGEPISYYTFWDPRGKVDEENTEEKGYFGTLTTLAFNGEGDAVYLKPCADYFGPRRGPHNLYGTYTVPNRPWPLSALLATWEQQRELNEIATANNESARKFKRLALADDPDLVSLIKSGAHDYAFYHEGLDKDRVMELTIGGIDAQMLTQEQRLRSTLDENLGITETMRGNMSADTTATEAAIAQASAGTRQGFTQKKFIDGMIEDLRGVLHYGLKDDRIYAMLGPEASADMGMEDALFRGGEEETVEDFEMQIEVGSMAYTSPDQDKANAYGMLELVGQISGLAYQYPHLDIPALVDMVADPAGHPELPKLFDYEILQQMRMLHAQAELQAPQANQQAQPRVGKASGPTRLLQGGGPGSDAKSLKPQHTAPDGAGSSATAQRPQQLQAGGS